MTIQRLSQLQQRILAYLWADHQRTRGTVSSGHVDMVKYLQHDSGNLSHSLATLERHGLIAVGRTSGGHAENVMLTKDGRELVVKLAGSCG